MIELNKIKHVQVNGIDPRDYPDFCDAYIDYAVYDNGQELTEEELDELNERHPDFVYEKVIDFLF